MQGCLADCLHCKVDVLNCRIVRSNNKVAAVNVCKQLGAGLRVHALQQAHTIRSIRDTPAAAHTQAARRHAGRPVKQSGPLPVRKQRDFRPPWHLAGLPQEPPLLSCMHHLMPDSSCLCGAPALLVIICPVLDTVLQMTACTDS